MPPILDIFITFLKSKSFIVVKLFTASTFDNTASDLLREYAKTLVAKGLDSISSLDFWSLRSIIFLILRKFFAIDLGPPLNTTKIPIAIKIVTLAIEIPIILALLVFLASSGDIIVISVTPGTFIRKASLLLPIQ